MTELHKKDRITLEITSISNKGQGVGRHNGIVIFVPETAPGDLVEVEIINVQKSHAFGLMKKLLTKSLDRVENTCKVYPECGGCSLRHLSYDRETQEKEKMVEENLRRIGQTNVVLEPMIVSPKVDRYRNKAQYPVQRVDGKAKLGFYESRSHTLIPLEDCLLQPKEFSELSQAFCEFLEEEQISIYDEQTHKGLVRHFYLRCSKDCQEIMVTIVINGNKLPQGEKLIEKLLRVSPMVKTIVLSHHTKKNNLVLGDTETILFGNGKIKDILCGVELELSAASFYQVNRDAAELLYQKAKEYADPKPNEILLDLYCGIGSIGLSMANEVKELYGVEIVKQAIIDAKQNAKRNGFVNTHFFVGDAGKAAAKLAGEGLTPDIIIVDPPRKGIDLPTIEAICKMNPSRVVYVSCNSATLARDIKLLEERNYKGVKGCAVDLFPRTPHVESVVLLERK